MFFLFVGYLKMYYSPVLVLKEGNSQYKAPQQQQALEHWAWSCRCHTEYYVILFFITGEPVYIAAASKWLSFHSFLKGTDYENPMQVFYFVVFCII